MPEIYNNNAVQPKEENSKSNLIPSSIRINHSTNNALGSFLLNPKNIHLNILEKDERVIMLLREHPITLIGRFFIISIIIIATIVLSQFTDFSFIQGKYLSTVGVLWFLFLFGMLFEKIISWYFNTIIITDERIIDIDFLHLIYKNITITKIDNIEDVTYSVTGVFPNLLNFGNILIQTAGAGLHMTPQETMASIEIWNVPNPAKVINILNELMLLEEQEKLDGRAK